jgi:hypothetical protein
MDKQWEHKIGRRDARLLECNPKSRLFPVATGALCHPKVSPTEYANGKYEFGTVVFVWLISTSWPNNQVSPWFHALIGGV